MCEAGKPRERSVLPMTAKRRTEGQSFGRTAGYEKWGQESVSRHPGLNACPHTARSSASLTAAPAPRAMSSAHPASALRPKPRPAPPGR